MIVNEQVAIDHGLKKDEYAKICELLDRTPNITELGIFSAMWNAQMACPFTIMIMTHCFGRNLP